MTTPQAAPHIVITRPAPKGQALVELLAKQGYRSKAISLFSYQAKTSFIAQQDLFTDPNALIIFISVPAVIYANKQLAIKNWQYDKIFAVGKATQQALADLGINAISPPQQDSEGLLALPELAQVKDKNIIIIRGDEGRELLATELTERGAKVTYCQSYFCQWQPAEQTLLIDLAQIKVTTMVITSVALLENMLDLLTAGQQPEFAKINLLPLQYWQEQCVWIVASARIAERAKQLGLQKIVNAQGADNQCLLQAIIAMEKNND